MVGSRRLLRSFGKAGSFRALAIALVTGVLGLSQAACGCDCEDKPNRPPDNPQGCVLGGKVFVDANRNGSDDPGETPVPNVPVTVFKCDGSVERQLLTGQDGTWQISITACVSTDRYLIRYTDWPAQYEAGFFGPDSETDIQISQPNDLHNHLGLQITELTECSPNDPFTPLIATACYLKGAAPGKTQPGYVSFPWDAVGKPPMYGGVGPMPSVSAAIQDVGSVWGAGWNEPTRRLYTGAYLRRGAGLGPQGIGGIYQFDWSALAPPANVETSFSIDGLLACDGTTIRCDDPASPLVRSAVLGDDNFLASAEPFFNRDNDAFGKCARIGLGDLEMGEDGKTLWIVNCYQRSLVTVDVGDPAVLPPTAKVCQYPIASIPGAPTCTGGVLRPWGLKMHGGRGYLGVVCSGETSQTRADMRAFVLSFDPLNPMGGFTTEIQFPLVFKREETVPQQAGGQTDWQCWALLPTQVSLYGQNGGNNAGSYPQPIVSDIEFAEDGDMIIAMMDRMGLQQMEMDFTPFPGATTQSSYVGPAGDILHACRLGNGTFSLEGSPNCLIDNDLGARVGTVGTAYTDDGPNGVGEFYWQDSEINHQEGSQGALALLPGTNQVVSTVFDAVDTPRGQGIHTYSTNDGLLARNYLVARTDPGNAGINKAIGLGDIEVICIQAYSEHLDIWVGGRVWIDTDQDGLQDACELGIAGLTVEFLCDGVVQGSTVTDSQGRYWFRSQDLTCDVVSWNTTRYRARVSLAAPQIGGRTLTTLNAGGDDRRDSDATAGGGFASAPLHTPGFGQANYTSDFGFRN